MLRVEAIVATVLVATGCTYHGTPVPVTGDTRDLEGEWEGTYSSDQTGRTGSILFHLKAGTDSAWGDVLMVPVRVEVAGPATEPPFPKTFGKPPRLLRISFVRCEDGLVNGQLDPYEDPDTGERIRTTFEGRLRGSEFLGTFSTAYPGSGHLVSGTWSVKRRK